MEAKENMLQNIAVLANPSNKDHQMQGGFTL